MMVRKGNHPKMAELIRLVNYSNLPRHHVLAYSKHVATFTSSFTQLCKHTQTVFQHIGDFSTTLMYSNLRYGFMENPSLKFDDHLNMLRRFVVVAMLTPFRCHACPSATAWHCPECFPLGYLAPGGSLNWWSKFLIPSDQR